MRAPCIWIQISTPYLLHPSDVVPRVGAAALVREQADQLVLAFRGRRGGGGGLGGEATQIVSTLGSIASWLVGEEGVGEED